MRLPTGVKTTGAVAVGEGRGGNGRGHVISRRFQYAEVDEQGNVRDPGPEPYLGYEPASKEQIAVLRERLDLNWVDVEAEGMARDWAIENMAGRHLEEIAKVTENRVEKVRTAVWERLTNEIRYWDTRHHELQELERQGKTPQINAAQAAKRAEDLETRLTLRRLELDRERNLQNAPPQIVAAALVIPQGLLDTENGNPSPEAPDPELVQDTDRRAVAAVMEAERKLGRKPQEQAHANPGYDVLSKDPASGTHYFIEVKGHLPQTAEINVSAQQVQKAKSNPERWRLAVVSVPESPDDAPVVRYLLDPFRDVNMHFAQTRLTLKVEDLLLTAGKPR